jgi:ABC-type phosphate transport system substrate-binding protein
MMARQYPLVAAAIAMALGSSFAYAAPPTVAQAAAATDTLVISGSSAAQVAVQTGIQNDICGGASNTLVVKSSGGSGNFLAFSCSTATTITTSAGTISSGTLVTIFYRTEGGSVVGALPVVSGKAIKRLDLTQCTSAGVCTVNGVTATSGPNDTWSGAVTPATTQLGVTDVEPGQLVGPDYPSNYSSTAFGTATPSQLAKLTTSRLFDQIFGLVVNTSGESFSSVNLTKQSAANILLGNYSDWSQVPDALTGDAISSSSPALITHVDREPGSGTRTGTNIFYLGTGCGSTASIPNPTGETLNFSTTDELTLANNTAGSIAYTSIDQILNPANGTKFPNLVLASIDGVKPSTLAAATGQYGEWFEATLVPAPGVSGASLVLSQFLQGDLPKLATAPALPDILVIPNLGGNTATVPLTANTTTTGTTQIFVNAYTRSGNSCNVPAEQN